MKGKVFVVVFCVCVSLLSCSNGFNSQNALKYLDIEGAKNLYISAGNANRSARNGADSQKIFKITENGDVEEVKYLDEGKKEITISDPPIAILPVNDDYIFVGFGAGETIYSSYLVRKSDGAVFDMKNAGNLASSQVDYKNAKRIKTDNNNNMYFLSYDMQNSSKTRIVKIHLDGSDSLKASYVSDDTEEVFVFDVDWAGNVIYSGDRGNRVRKPDNGFEIIDSTGAFWIGLDGDIYYCPDDISYTSSEGGNSNNRLSIMRVESGTPVEEPYGYINLGSENYHINQGVAYKVDLNDKIYIISFNAVGSFMIAEVYNESKSPRKVELDSLQIKTISTVASSENYYYIAGTDSNNETFLVKIDPDSDKCTHLLEQGKYDVYSFTASETDGITFNALRLSDGKKVIGKVGINGGDVTMIDEESNAQITYLERIN